MTRRDFFGRLCGLAGAGVVAAAGPPSPPPPAPPPVATSTAASPTWTLSTGQTWTCSSGIAEADFLNVLLAHRKAAAP